MKETQNKARRLILRSLVLGGSATAATKLMPQSWVRPVVDVVVAPAHATMSDDVVPGDDDTMGEEDPVMPTGLFQTEVDGALLGKSNNSSSPLESFAKNSADNMSVLDYFIQPAQAQEDDSFCDNVASNIQITFEISENPGSVNIDICDAFNEAIESLTADIDGEGIADNITSDYSLTNMIASDSEVTGTLGFPTHGGNLLCSTDFSAPLVDVADGCPI